MKPRTTCSDHAVFKYCGSSPCSLSDDRKPHPKVGEHLQAKDEQVSEGPNRSLAGTRNRVSTRLKLKRSICIVPNPIRDQTRLRTTCFGTRTSNCLTCGDFLIQRGDIVRHVCGKFVCRRSVGGISDERVRPVVHRLDPIRGFRGHRHAGLLLPGAVHGSGRNSGCVRWPSFHPLMEGKWRAEGEASLGADRAAQMLSHWIGRRLGWRSVDWRETSRTAKPRAGLCLCSGNRNSGPNSRRPGRPTQAQR